MCSINVGDTSQIGRDFLNNSPLMFLGGPRLARRAKGIRHYSSAPTYRKVNVLEDGNVDTFRQKAFSLAVPATLPHGHFAHLPAVTAWFTGLGPDSTIQSLDRTYLDPYGETFVPLELTQAGPSSTSFSTEPAFRRFTAPLRLFLDWTERGTAATPYRLYLAQAQVTGLPRQLRDDLPTPDLIRKAGKGDIYDTNVWIGLAPTYTPLHRDPNPNLFVQLAGTKVVRLFEPAVGEQIYTQVRAKLGGAGSGVFRGEEMMQGEEKRVLEAEVWGARDTSLKGDTRGYEARLGRGDGLFIPKGWWHSIRGVGEGVTGSVSRRICGQLTISRRTDRAQVNWWFR